MAERFSRKVPSRSAAPSPANTTAAARNTGSSAVCQSVEMSLRAAVVKKPGTAPRCLQAPWGVSVMR